MSLAIAEVHAGGERAVAGADDGAPHRPVDARGAQARAYSAGRARAQSAAEPAPSRAAGPVIHWLSPLLSAILPSIASASLSVR